MSETNKYIFLIKEHFREFGYSKIDDRALYEIYLQPFKACVVAGVSAVMCGYNKLLTDNGELEYACEHSTIIDILKNELGFNGFLMSDWWSIKGDGVKAANNGLDMMMAGEILYNSTSEKPSDFMWSENLVKMVLESKVKESTVNDKVERILASWYKIGQDQNYPKLNLHSFDAKKDGMVNVKRDHANLIRRAAADSIILLKNDNVLPLSMSLSGISVIGENAFSAADPNVIETNLDIPR